MLMQTRTIITAALALAGALVQAQGFPERAITFVVPFAAHTKSAGCLHVDSRARL